MTYGNESSQLVDPRELIRREELRQEIANGNQFAAGELNFRIVQQQRGMCYDQIEKAIENFFSAPF